MVKFHCSVVDFLNVFSKKEKEYLIFKLLRCVEHEEMRYSDFFHLLLIWPLFREMGVMHCNSRHCIVVTVAIRLIQLYTNTAVLPVAGLDHACLGLVVLFVWWMPRNFPFHLHAPCWAFTHKSPLQILFRGEWVRKHKKWASSWSRKSHHYDAP